jgi:hypothetical protein
MKFGRVFYQRWKMVDEDRWVSGRMSGLVSLGDMEKCPVHIVTSSEPRDNGFCKNPSHSLRSLAAALVAYHKAGTLGGS